MLREITTTRTFKGARRRWFSDSHMDLFVWFKSQAPVHFQLTYNKQYNEHAICWDRHTGFSHNRVDDGEKCVTEYKMSPLITSLLSQDDTYSTASLARAFLEACENIDPTLADFIYARLLEYPQQYTPSPDHHTTVKGD